MKIHLRRYFKKAVPGVITGAADNDPSGITTYSLSGAIYGYSQLWLMVLAAPMLIAVQSMSAKIANVRHKGLATIFREQFSPVISWLAMAVLIIVNVATIGADILAVSLAFEMLTGIAMVFWILPVVIFVWYLIVFKNYRALRKFLLLMVLFFFAYIFSAIMAKPDWLQVSKGLFVPSFPAHDAKGFFAAAVAILGTTITPYVFFWQAKEELEEHHSIAAAKSEVKHEDQVNAPGFIFSQIITIFIIIAAGATLYQSGVGLHTATDAAKALAPLAGSLASGLFALGIIGAGLLALPILSISASEVVAETFNFHHHGLDNKPKSAKAFYTVASLMLIGGLLVVITGIDPLKALFWSQILAGLISPLLIALILWVCNSKSAMGEYTNGWFDNIFGFLTLIMMLTAGILMFAA